MGTGLGDGVRVGVGEGLGVGVVDGGVEGPALGLVLLEGPGEGARLELAVGRAATMAFIIGLDGVDPPPPPHPTTTKLARTQIETASVSGKCVL